MNTPDRNASGTELAATLAEFIALSAADRKAVETLLSPAERQALERLARLGRAQPSASAARRDRRDVSAEFSPWMTKRLKKLMEPDARSSSSHLTRATQDVLSSLLSRQPAR